MKFVIPIKPTAQMRTAVGAIKLGNGKVRGNAHKKKEQVSNEETIKAFLAQHKPERQINCAVMRCVPDLAKQNPKVIIAFLDMAYNIGPTALCKSSIARHANAGEWTEACYRIAEIYKTAKGIPLQGLVIRRTDESEMCLQGLKEGR